MQAVSHLLYWDSGFDSLNHRNLEGQTQVNNREIRIMLKRAGDNLWFSLSTFYWFAKLARSVNLVRKKYAREIMAFSDERCSMLLVVAVMLVTISYQTVLSPPGELWQDDIKCINGTEVGNKI